MVPNQAFPASSFEDNVGLSFHYSSIEGNGGLYGAPLNGNPDGKVARDLSQPKCEVML